uniref:Uncharacterized protein n=1 Tax=Panagrolaimus sp. JU765 TaxID=591449 RepID=A0AC34QWR2_9BILA
MRKLLLFVVCAGLFACICADFQLFGKHGESTWKKRLHYQDRGFCQDLGNLTKKNLFKYLICNLTAVKNECKERATETFYLTSRENVSRAVRGAAHLFPRVREFILSMENTSYAAIDCYWNAFFQVEQDVANGVYPYDQWDEHWSALCDGYRDEVQPFYDTLNRTGGPYWEVFGYTYPNLVRYPNITFFAVLRDWGKMLWPNTTADQFYSRVFANLALFPKWNATDRDNCASNIAWTPDWVLTNGYLYENFTTLIQIGMKKANFEYGPTTNPEPTTAEYEQLAKIIYIFQQYFKEKSIIFFNDFFNKLVAANVTDDLSDPIVTSVSYLWGDFIGNLTGNNNTNTTPTNSTNSTGPSDEWLNRVCNYLTNGTTTFPHFPGCAGRNIWNIFENVTQDAREQIGGTKDWFGKIKNKVKKVKDNIKNALDNLKNKNNNDNGWNFNWG